MARQRYSAPSSLPVPTPASYFFWTDGVSVFRWNLVSGVMKEAANLNSLELKTIIEPILPAYVIIRCAYVNSSGKVVNAPVTYTPTNGGSSTTGFLAGSIFKCDANVKIIVSGQKFLMQTNVELDHALVQDSASYDNSGIQGNPALVYYAINASQVTATNTWRYGDILTGWATANITGGGPRVLVAANVDPNSGGDIIYLTANGTTSQPCIRIVQASSGSKGIIFSPAVAVGVMINLIPHNNSANLIQATNTANNKVLWLLQLGSSGNRVAQLFWDVTANANKYFYIDNAATVVAAALPS